MASILDLEKIEKDLNESKAFLDKTQKSLLGIVGSDIIDCNINPRSPLGWRQGEGTEHRRGGHVILDRCGGDLYVNGKKVELFLAFGQKKGIMGCILYDILTKKPVLNANILDYLLQPKNQHLIPESWENEHTYFWGDTYRNANGNLCVRYLYKDGRQWDWHYDFVGSNFGSNSPAAVSLGQILQLRFLINRQPSFCH